MPRYVIQKHDARRLHYDFRLELAGVLLSWAVPRGPSLAPAARRLAVRVDDHALAHADYEGSTVIIWDRGTWAMDPPDADAAAALAAGKLRFTLDGAKLHGRWHLVRTKPRGKQDQWLLFKGRDAHADDTLDIVAAQPASVVSGRTIG